MIRFRTEEFEQLFTTQTLEKGLRLSKRKTPVLCEKNGSHFSYQVADHFVSLHRKASEISQGYCSCGKKYCHHFAAVMFSFMDTQLLKKAPVSPRPGRSAQTKRFRDTFLYLRALHDSEHRKNGAQTALNALVAESQKIVTEKKPVITLAVLAALSLPGRIASGSASVAELTNQIMLGQHGAFHHGTCEEVMYLAILEMIRSNERVSSGRINALLPVYLAGCKNMFRLDEIRLILNRRHIKKFHAELFDELQISRQLVHFRILQMEGKEIQLSRSGSVEGYVALARLFFASQQIEKAWKLMDELRLITRETAPLSYFDLLSYLVTLSAALKDRNRQISYTEELMLYSPYLSMPLVQTFLSQVPDSQREKRIRDVMSKVMESRAESVVDKIYVLSMASGITDVFLGLIRRNHVRFFMIHDFYMKFHHKLNMDEISLYFRKFCEQLSRHEHGPKQPLMDLGAKFVLELGHSGKTYARNVAQFMESNALLSPLTNHWKNSTGEQRSLSLQA